jgi:solute carrier family 13 (sodium-dependent dicarboxylate transporter), member 2/3/5
LALGLFLLAALYWIAEPIPIYATSMLVILGQLLLLSSAAPLVGGFAFPYAAEAAPAPTRFTGTLAHPTLILFLGGFMLAAAAAKYAVEQALTRVLLQPFGNRAPRVLLGLMASTALLSAFMSNTATTAMMMAVILPVVAILPAEDRFRIALALAIPVAANLGGMATPIGTPPNAIALGALAGQGHVITFTTWMLLATPLVVLSLFLAWRILLWAFPPSLARLPLQLDGRFSRSRPAGLLYGIGGLTVALWLTEALHGIPSGVVAFLPIALLPACGVLERSDIRGLSWEVLWLVAGGISLGLSLNDTGLAAWLIALVSWDTLGAGWVLLGFVVVSILVANFLSNTVTTSLLVPIVMSLGVAGVWGDTGSLLAVAIAVALASSYGMSLPISTPPNAIAVGTGLVSTPQMARIGVVMALLGVMLVYAAARWFWPLLLR